MLQYMLLDSCRVMVYVCMYICMIECMCVSIYAYMIVSIWVHAHMPLCIFLCLYDWMHMIICAYVYVEWVSVYFMYLWLIKWNKYILLLFSWFTLTSTIKCGMVFLFEKPHLKSDCKDCIFMMTYRVVLLVRCM